MASSVLWSGYFTIVVIVIAIIILVYITSRKKIRCPRCGSTSVQKIPKQWVTSPQGGWSETPVTLTSHYKYKCRKCQNEWEDY